MRTLFLNGLKFDFIGKLEIIDFEDTNPDLREVFFFDETGLVTSQFLTLFELNKIKNA